MVGLRVQLVRTSRAQMCRCDGRWAYPGAALVDKLLSGGQKRWAVQHHLSRWAVQQHLVLRRAVQHRCRVGRVVQVVQHCTSFSASSGAGCSTLHRDERVAGRLRARGLVPAAGCAALLLNKFSNPARLLQERIVRNLFPSLSTAARKRCCTSTALRFFVGWVLLFDIPRFQETLQLSPGISRSIEL